MLSRERQSLRKEHVFCLHLISKEIKVLPGNFIVVRRPSFSGFDMNTISDDFPIERYMQKCNVYEFMKCTNLGIYRLIKITKRQKLLTDKLVKLQLWTKLLRQNRKSIFQ